MEDKNTVVTLKRSKGEINLYLCPECGCYVDSHDVYWKATPLDHDVGEVECCVFCKKEKKS